MLKTNPFAKKPARPIARPTKPLTKAPNPITKAVGPAVSILTQGFRARRAELLTKWREWATAVADGGKTPSATELAQVALELAIHKPTAAFEADVNAIVSYRKSKARADRKRAAYKEALMPWNGSELAVREEIKRLKARVEELEGLIGPYTLYGIDAWANRIRVQNPRALGDFDKVLEGINRQMEPAA